MVMDEERVRRYLDNLLVELEVLRGDAGVMKKIEGGVNCYKKAYPYLIKEYQEKGNKIINQFR